MTQYRALPYQPSPVPAFSRLRDWAWPILLDSQDAGRWDIMTAAPVASAWLTTLGGWMVDGCTAPAHHTDAFAMLARLHVPASRPEADDHPALPFHGGVLGYVGYAADSERGLPPRRGDDWPLAALARYDWALCSDHQRRESWLVWQDEIAPEKLARILAWATQADAPDGDDTRTGAAPLRLTRHFQARTSLARYAADIARIQDWIRAGDCYQVNYTQAWEALYEGEAWSAWPALRQAARAPHACYWRLPWGELLSLSPEQFLAMEPQPDGSTEVITRPIKGTRRRQDEPAADAAEAAALLASGKDRAENVMITDLLRNDLGKHAGIGSVQVTGLCRLESFGQVHHLVSTITARLAAPATPADILRDAFPGGSITGAPKKRAMEIIEALEPTARGVYCGSVILWDSLGRLDSSIAIRTLVARDGALRAWAGGGITLESRWEDEHEECLNKMGGLLRLLETR